MGIKRVFRCSRTGLMYPEDYIEGWGSKYGIGLGPVPISEALINEYHKPIAIAEDDNTTMHPLAVCRAQMDCLDVEEEDYEINKAILAIDDPKCSRRGKLMRDKQLVKSERLKGMFPDHVVAASERLNKKQY